MPTVGTDESDSEKKEKSEGFLVGEKNQKPKLPRKSGLRRRGGTFGGGSQEKERIGCGWDRERQKQNVPTKKRGGGPQKRSSWD